MDEDQYNSTIVYNITAPFAPYTATNMMNNAILKTYSKNPDSKIKMRFEPLLSNNYNQMFNEIILGNMIVLIWTLAFTFIPSRMIVFIIKERENNSKHL